MRSLSIVKEKDIGTNSLIEILETVLHHHTTVTVQMDNGEEVIIQPKKKLRPLPELDGSLPKDWKDAIYE
jgi:hypothetical protein